MFYCEMNFPAPANASAVAVANNIAFSAIWRRFPYSDCYSAGSGAGIWTRMSSRCVILAS